MAITDKSSKEPGPEKLRLLDVNTGKPRTEFDLSPAPVGSFLSAVFSPDGKLLATGLPGTGLPGGEHRIWDTVTGEVVKVFDGSLAIDCATTFSPDGTKLVTGGAQGRIWDTQTWKELVSLKPPKTARFDSPAFSPDGKYVAAISRKDESVTLYDAQTGQEHRKLKYQGYGRQLVFAAGGKRLIAGDTVYDVAKGAALYSDDFLGQGPHIAHPDGKSFFALSNSGGTIAQFSATSDRLEKLPGREWRFPGVVDNFALTTDGRYLFASNHNGTVYILRLAEGK